MNVLIADDDATTRLMLTAAVRQMGYTVVEARNGLEAWERLVSPDPARLAIVDWMMPDLSGPELCVKLRAQRLTPAPYVILLTSKDHWSDKIDGLEAGADDYLTKPHNVEELRVRLKVGCRIVRLQEELMGLNDQLEARVRERTEHVRQLLQQKQELIVQLGHDLRTPLTPLVALLPMLVAGEADLIRRDSLQICLEQTRHLRRLAERIFDLGRLDAPASPLEIEPVSLSSVVESSVESVAQGRAQVMARVVRQVPAGLRIRADRLWLQRVLEELLDNAMRFSPPDADIKVIVESQGQSALFSVSDRGCGLRADQLERVFEPFYTGDPSRTNRHANGLGLSLCRRIVEKHGGRIWAESAGADRGTNIRFTVPLVPEGCAPDVPSPGLACLQHV